ncbi:MAG: glycogen-binding domain-containing protein, partial [Treponema sp.]|nr:glycogen-binding domain-containing protein [Treponema sp.]
KPEILKGPPGTLNFSFQGPPGETVTVAGSFNGWDPFMYEMKEVSAGNYNFTLPLPPGKYQYIFFCRGERWLDLFNPNRAYSRDGIAVSEVVLQ